MSRPKKSRRNRLNTTVKPSTTFALARLAKDLDLPAGRIIDAAMDAYGESLLRQAARNLDEPRTWDEAQELLDLLDLLPIMKKGKE